MTLSERLDTFSQWLLIGLLPFLFIPTSVFGVTQSKVALAQFEALEKLDPGQEVVQQILVNLRANRAPIEKEAATTTPATRR